MIVVALDVATVHEKIWDAMLLKLREGTNKMQDERLARFLENLQKDATVEGLRAYGDNLDEINPSTMTSGNHTETNPTVPNSE